jgi:Fe-S-cluster containining protein
MNEEDEYFFYSPSKKISLKEAKKEVELYIEENGTNSNWSGCLKKNHCCKLFFYDPNNKSNQDFYETICKDGEKLKYGHNCFKCKQLKEDGDEGVESCSIYKNRPKICRDFLCEPAILRGEIYRDRSS